MCNQTSSPKPQPTQDELKKEAMDALCAGDYHTAQVDLTLVHEINEAKERLAESKPAGA